MMEEINKKFSIDNETKKLLVIPSNKMLSFIQPCISKKDMQDLILLVKKATTSTLNNAENDNM